MRVRAAVVAVVLALLPGCRLFDRINGKDRDRDRPSAEPASRTRDPVRDRPRIGPDDPSRPPRDWLDDPTRDRPRGRGDAKADTASDTRRVISGVLEDEAGKRVGNAYVSIEPYPPPQPGGAPMGVNTDDYGFFLFPGLQVGQTYVLTAQVKVGPRPLGGRQYVKVPNQGVRMVLKEDLALAPLRADGSAADLPPSAGGIPVPPPAGSTGLFDQPTPRDRSALPYPAESGGPEFSPVGPAPGAAPRPVPRRPELVAPGPGGKDWNGSPPASIPNPLPPPNLNSSRKETGRAEIQLVSAAGRPRAFPSGRDGELVLLDFLTTWCGPCKKAIPTLSALQSKYESAGLEVVGVVCDDAPEAERRELAAAYQDEYRPGYGLYVEPGRGGELGRRYGVKAYPTLVLLDGTGRVLWKGHPSEVRQLEQVIREAGR